MLKVFLRGREFPLRQPSGRPLFLRTPLFWMLLGIVGLVALTPGWLGIYPVTWLSPLSWTAIIVVILAIAKGALNYVNGKSFWSGTPREFQSGEMEAIRRLSSNWEETRMALAFMRWAARSQLKLELSSEQRDSLLKDIRESISQLTVDDFFAAEKRRAKEVVGEAEGHLNVIRRMAEEMQEKVQGNASRIARDLLTQESLSSAKEKVRSEIDSHLDASYAQAKQKTKALTDDLDRHVREAVEKEVATALRNSSIDGRLEGSIPRHFHEIEMGLMEFLGQQIRRANVYLFAGVAIGLTGITFFSFYFVSLPANPNVWMLLARAGLLLAFEAFAMFFLRLYKASLSSVEFFQNEITTVRSKKIGLDVAVQVAAQHDYKPLIEAINLLVSLDRNSILEKDQTTRTLEERKMYTKQEVELVRAASEVVRAARGK